MNVALIPVRGGSKSIPLKNIKDINGMPLLYWTMKAACECRYIDKVYVATDSDVIFRTVTHLIRTSAENLFAKAELIGRSAASSSDTASTEIVMLEFAKDYEFDYIALIQATSPLLDAKDLDRGFVALQENHIDSVMSVVRQKRFLWKADENGYGVPLNYDYLHRPRRQEFNGYLVENGAFYITKKQYLLQSKNRISGDIKMIEMPEDTFVEIDEPSDWLFVEMLMKRRTYELKHPARPEIKMLLTDCDGCLTDGGMYYSEKGDELKKFNAKDGMAFRLLKQMGIIVGIITAEDMQINRNRAKKLNLDILENGCQDKLAAVGRLCQQYGIEMSNVAYIGDDVNDLAVLQSVGYPCCPANAMSPLKDIAKYVTSAKGGEGVIREVTERIREERRYPSIGSDT
jgi:N-acylneuraminate cytidylyltransferase